MNIKQIKDNYTCLDYLGKPAKKVANGYLYHAPWREDKHPSLSVTLDGRGWHDLATGAKGSVIDLVMMHLNTRDFRRVIEELENVRPNSFSFYPKSVFRITRLQNVSKTCQFVSLCYCPTTFLTLKKHPLKSRGLVCNFLIQL
jgi:hypothetical protein